MSSTYKDINDQNEYLNQQLKVVSNETSKDNTLSNDILLKTINEQITYKYLFYVYYALFLRFCYYLYNTKKNNYLKISIVLFLLFYPYFIFYIENFIYENVIFIGNSISGLPYKKKRSRRVQFSPIVNIF